MKQTDTIRPPYEPCGDHTMPAGFVDAPARFVDAGNEMRLIPELRDAAATRDPYEILARSAAAFLRAQNPTAGSLPSDDEQLGNALADLAVSGRRTYCLLATPPL